MTGGGQNYDFRQSRWGDPKIKVKFSERELGSAPRDFGHVLIYKATLWDTPMKIIYVFDEDNRLRSAGYLGDKPFKQTKLIREYAFFLHGEPRNQSHTLGYGWVTKRSLIYLNLPAAVGVLSPYVYGGGPFSQLSEQLPGKTNVAYTAVWGYMDRTFESQLQSVNELTHHEKLLFGVMKARMIWIYGKERIPETPEIP